MWWALPAGMALLGAQNAQRRADQQRSFNMGQAETSRYSPWTHMQGHLDNSYSPSALEGGMQGGMAGLGAMQGMQSLGGAGAGAQPGAGVQYPMTMNDNPSLYQSQANNYGSLS